MTRAEFYQKILAELEKSESIENLNFEVMGINCFVSRNIYPKTEFSAGVTGRLTAIHNIDNIRGFIGGYADYVYEGNAPGLKIVASAIFDCAVREGMVD